MCTKKWKGSDFRTFPFSFFHSEPFHSSMTENQMQNLTSHAKDVCRSGKTPMCNKARAIWETLKKKKKNGNRNTEFFRQGLCFDSVTDINHDVRARRNSDTLGEE